MMLKVVLVLLSALNTVMSACPANEPSCLYQETASTSGATNLYTTSSCSAIPTYLIFVREQLSTSRWVITQMKVATSDSQLYSLTTSQFSDNASQVTMSLAAKSVKKIEVYYKVDGPLTEIRRIQITFSDNSEGAQGNAGSNIAGATYASLTLTGALVGFMVDSNTNLFYVKQRYTPTLSPATIPMFDYRLGNPTQTTAVAVAWPVTVPTTPPVAAASIYSSLDDTTIVANSYVPSTVTLTLNLITENQANADAYMGLHTRNLFLFYDNVCALQSSFQVKVQVTSCLTKVLSLPALTETYFEQFIYYPTLSYTFSPGTYSLTPLCGLLYYWINPASAPGVVVPNWSNPTLTIQSNDISLADGVNRVFKVTLGFKKYDIYTQFVQSVPLNVKWKNPCGLANNTVTTVNTISNMETSVLVPIQSVLYTGWKCYVDTLYNGGCGKFTYRFATGTPAVLSSVTYIDKTLAPQFLIGLSPTSNTQQGTYSVQIEGYLQNYPSVIALSAAFTMKINYCVVTGMTVSLAKTTQSYTLTGSQFTNQISVVQTPACGYAYTLSVSTSAPSDLTWVNQLIQVNQSTKQLEIGTYSDLAILSHSNQFIILVTATISASAAENVGGVSIASESYTLNLVNPCESTTIESKTISVTMTSLDPLNSLVVTDFTDTVSSGQGGSTFYCGDRQYELLLATSHPYTLALQSSAPPSLNYQSTSLSDENGSPYTRTLKVSLVSYPTIVRYQSFTVTVLNPCRTTTINLPPSPLLAFEATVMQPFVSYSFSAFEDAASKLYGTGTNICGQRKYSLTWQTIDNWGGTFISGNMFLPDQYTPTISAGSNTQSKTGNYTITIFCQLKDYSTVATVSTTVSFKLLPCRVDSFTMNTPDVTMYVYNYFGSPKNALTFTYSTIQAVSCGYQAKVSVQTLLPSNASDFTVFSTANQVVQFSLLPTLRSQVRSYTITLTFELIDYPTWFYPYYLKTQSFNLNVLDPCPQTQIVMQTISQMETLTSYTYKLDKELSLSDFNSDPDYNSVKPFYGVYFADTVSSRVNRWEFCGKKIFAFSGNYPGCVTLTGENAKTLTLYAAKNCIPKVYDVSLNVSMFEFPTTSILSNFTAAVIKVQPSMISNQVYYLKSAKTTITVGPFAITTGSNQTYIPQNMTYTAYLKISKGTLTPPIHCPTIYSVGGLFELPEYMVFDNENLTISYFTDDVSFIGNYSIVVCQNFEALQISFASQFRLIIKPESGFGSKLLGQLPSIDNSQISISTCQDAPEDMQYQLPIIKDPSGSEVTATVTLGSLSSIFAFYPSNMTLVSIKPFKDQSGLKKIDVKYSSKSDQEVSYTLSLVFACLDAYVVKSVDEDVLNQLSAQTTFPQATISKISNDGLVYIQFSQQMNSTEEELATILNSTVMLRGQPVRILSVKLFNSNGLSQEVQNMTWSVVSYKSKQLVLKLEFANPSFVSAYSNKDSVQVSFQAFWLFRDQKGNYIKQNTVTQTAELPPQTSPGQMAGLIQVAQQTTSTFSSLMGGNAVLQLLMAGSIQQLFSAMRTIQIIAHMMLINVSTPSSAQIFFGALLKLVTMDLFPSLTSLVVDKLQMDEVPGINSNFEEFGYSTKQAFINYGSSSFLFILVPVIAIVSKLLAQLNVNGISQRAQQLYNNIFWNGILGYFYEMYTVIAICSIMNFYYFHFNNIGNVVSSSLAILFACITIALPIFYSVFYYRNYQRLLQRDEAITRRFGTLTQELNLLRVGRSAMIQPLINMLRKLMLVSFVVFFNKKPLASVYMVNFTSLAFGITIGWIQPFNSVSLNRVELVNEFFILLANYHLFCFTDFVPPQGKETMGTSLIYVTLTNFAVSIGAVLISSAIEAYWKAKTVYLRWKQQKDIRERIEQKQQAQIARHLDYVAQLERKAFLENRIRMMQEERQRRLQVIQEQDEYDEESAVSSEPKLEDYELELELEQAELKQLSKKIDKTKFKQFKVDSKIIEAERQDRQIRQNMPIAAKFKPLVGTFSQIADTNQMSQMTQIFNLDEIPWTQYTNSSQSHNIYQAKLDQTLAFLEKDPLMNRAMNTKQPEPQMTQLIQEEPVIEDLILKIPAKFLKQPAGNSRNI